ncbi:MAG: class I SAM-dependent methyltransferase [Rhizobiales bacterium]|nr:class I SAM-dependent methyltransferase [Hyphomicrobiales bacterium]
MVTDNDQGFYAPHYARFASDLSALIRREAYGEDLGQTSWRSLNEQERIAQLIRDQGASASVIDIACGSGGPSLALAKATGCSLVGVDIEQTGIEEARRNSIASELVELVRFEVADCNKPLPFRAESFDVVVCIDAIVHLDSRVSALADWTRLLIPGGQLIFTDAGVLTGCVSRTEIDVRAATGPFAIVPPGATEATIEAAGLHLEVREDTTPQMAEILSRLRIARDRHAVELEQAEGKERFADRRVFHEIAERLAASGRLSRFFYVARKPS